MISVSEQVCFWRHLNSGVLGPSALAGWKCFLLHAQSDILATLESNDGVGVNMGNVKGAIMMMKITNDYMAGCGGLRALYLVGCG